MEGRQQMINTTIEDIQKQSEFCMDLMNRLNIRIQSGTWEYGRLNGHTQAEADVIRLRRELNDLRKMLYPY